MNIKKEWIDNLRRQINDPYFANEDREFTDFVNETLDKLENGSLTINDLMSYLDKHKFSSGFFSLKYSAYEFIASNILLDDIAEKTRKHMGI